MITGGLMSTAAEDSYAEYTSLARCLNTFEPVGIEHWCHLITGADRTQAVQELRGRFRQMQSNEEYERLQGYEKTHGQIW